MKTDLDTLLTALYVFVDDQLVPASGLGTDGPGRRFGRRFGRRPGRPKRLSDAELICLAVAQVLLGYPSQHHWLRACYGRLGHLFPWLPKQPGYSKRLRAAGPMIAQAIQQLARHVSAESDEFRFIDATPIPCGCSVSTVKRSELAEVAGYGYCASHSRWYWGVKLYLVTTAHGMPITWCLANPKLGERDVAIELLGHARDQRLLPNGCVLIGDKGFEGFAGTDFRRQAAELGITFIRPDRKNEKHRFGNLGGIRQLIESVFDTAKGQLSLERHGARTTNSLHTRIAQRLLALATAIWHNRTTNAPITRSLIAYDH